MAQKVNITIDQGATFSYPFTVLDVNDDVEDLTTFAATAQLRRSYASTNAVSFTCTTSNVAPNLVIALTAIQTTNIAAGRYVYDVFLVTSGNVVTRHVEGIVTVTPQVTR